MRNPALLHPMFALAAWTALVLLLVPLVRVRAALQRRIRADDFRYGESAAVPDEVRIPNRNYMNLLELPMLFYVVCLLLYVTGGASTATIGWAWAYVALRVVHSLIHLTYKDVLHRLSAFTLSNVALVFLWILAGAQLAGAPS
jgi:hypothetical protein